MSDTRTIEPIAAFRMVSEPWRYVGSSDPRPPPCDHCRGRDVVALPSGRHTVTHTIKPCPECGRADAILEIEP